ncbi:CopG family transcriptional regulator [Enterococcus faecalis]|nr:CopG family transcriptional regulator [Enterococcus faecalis]
MATATPISVRLDNELNSMLNLAVKENNTTKTDFIRQAVLEKLEDMYDIEMADKAYQAWLDGGKKTFSHKELMERYG